MAMHKVSTITIFLVKIACIYYSIVKMLNAIDINQFLAQETVGASFVNEWVATILAAMALQCPNLLRNRRSSVTWGCIVWTKTINGLFDASTGKKVLFQYDPTTVIISQ